MALERAAYRPRDAERGVLHAVVSAHLETFLREAAHRAGGAGLHQFDVLACPRCGGRLRPIATIAAPHVIHEILAHLGLPPEVLHPDPPQPPPAEAGSLLADVLS